MNNSAAKVGEIFREAGTAFIKLSEMTMLLHPMGDSQPGGKWTEEEIEMLRGCVHRFAVDMNKLSQHIKNRTVSQIRTTLKKKAFEGAGIPVRQPTSSISEDDFGEQWNSPHTGTAEIHSDIFMSAESEDHSLSDDRYWKRDDRGQVDSIRDDPEQDFCIREDPEQDDCIRDDPEQNDSVSDDPEDDDCISLYEDPAQILELGLSPRRVDENTECNMN